MNTSNTNNELKQAVLHNTKVLAASIVEPDFDSLNLSNVVNIMSSIMRNEVSNTIHILNQDIHDLIDGVHKRIDNVNKTSNQSININTYK